MARQYRRYWKKEKFGKFKQKLCTVLIYNLHFILLNLLYIISTESIIDWSTT